MIMTRGRYCLLHAGAVWLIWSWAARIATAAEVLSESIVEKCESAIGDGTPVKCAHKVIVQLRVMPEEQGSTSLYLLKDGPDAPAPLKATIRSEPWYLFYPLTYETTMFDSMWETTFLKANSMFTLNDECSVPDTCGVAIKDDKIIPNSGGFCCDCHNIISTQPEAMFRPFADSPYNYVHGSDNSFMTQNQKKKLHHHLNRPMDCGTFGSSWKAAGQCLRFPQEKGDAAGHPPYWTPFTPHECDIDPTLCFPGEGRKSVIPPIPGVHYRASKYHVGKAGRYDLKFKAFVDIEEYDAESKTYKHMETVTLDQDGMKISYENVTAQFSFRGGEMTQFPELSDDYIFVPAYVGPRSDVLIIPAAECDPTGLSPGKIFFSYNGHKQSQNCAVSAETLLKDASLRNKWNTDADRAREGKPLKYMSSKYGIFIPKAEREVCQDNGEDEEIVNMFYHNDDGKKKQVCRKWGVKFMINNQVIPGHIILELDNFKTRWIEQVQPGYLTIDTIEDFRSGDANGGVTFTVTNSGVKPSSYFATLDNCGAEFNISPSTFTLSSKPGQASTPKRFSVSLRLLLDRTSNVCCDLSLISSLGIQIADVDKGSLLDQTQVCFNVSEFIEDDPADIIQGVGEDGDSVDEPGRGLIGDVIGGVIGGVGDGLSDVVGGVVEVVADGGDAVGDAVGDVLGGVAGGVDAGIAGLPSAVTSVPTGLIPAIAVLTPLALALVVAFFLCKCYRKKQKEKRRTKKAANKAATRALEMREDCEQHPAHNFDPDAPEYDEWARTTRMIE